MSKKIKCVSLLLTAFLLSAGTLEAAAPPVTRGEVLGKLMHCLEMPVSHGKSFGDVGENTPYGDEVDSALALGIIYPADDFSPSIPATNAETLMFALQTMGFRHEAALAAFLLPEETGLPDYISGYVALAKDLSPSAPRSVTAAPRGTTDADRLDEVLRWVKRCRGAVEWKYRKSETDGTLSVYRSSVGRPPSAWTVTLGSFDDFESAERARRGNAELKVRAGDRGFVLHAASFADRREAERERRKYSTRFPHAAVIADELIGDALFYVSYAPYSAGCMKIGFASAELNSTFASPEELAEKLNAVAAVNGGYFNRNGAVGAVFADSFPVTAPYFNRSMVAWNKSGEMHFGGGEYRTRISYGNNRPVTVEVNERVPMGGKGIFTPPAGKSGRRAGNNGTVVRVSQGKAVEVKKALQYRRDLKDGEWLLVSRDRKQAFEEGEKVTLETDWREPPHFEVDYAVQAGPLVYAPGRGMYPERLPGHIINSRHPRTLIGRDASGPVWIVIDGRSPWHSRGVTLHEAARIGHSLGLSALLNLDGGGSSVLIWRGHVMNHPVGGVTRNIPYLIYQ